MSEYHENTFRTIVRMQGAVSLGHTTSPPVYWKPRLSRFRPFSPLNITTPFYNGLESNELFTTTSKSKKISQLLYSTTRRQKNKLTKEAYQLKCKPSKQAGLSQQQSASRSHKRLGNNCLRINNDSQQYLWLRLNDLAYN